MIPFVKPTVDGRKFEKMGYITYQLVLPAIHLWVFPETKIEVSKNHGFSMLIRFFMVAKDYLFDFNT